MPAPWRSPPSPPAGVTVLGPAEAPLALMRGRHRFRLLVKTERAIDLQAYLQDLDRPLPEAARQRESRDRRRPAELFVIEAPLS